MSLYSVGLLLCWAIKSVSSVGLLVCWVLESSCSVALLFCWVLGSQCCVVLCCVGQNLCCRNTGLNTDTAPAQLLLILSSASAYPAAAAEQSLSINVNVLSSSLSEMTRSPTNCWPVPSGSSGARTSGQSFGHKGVGGNSCGFG